MKKIISLIAAGLFAFSGAAVWAAEDVGTEEIYGIAHTETGEIEDILGTAGTGEIEDIEVYWIENGYPDNLSYIACSYIPYHYAYYTENSDWSYEGSQDENENVYLYNIGLVNASDSQKQEIISLLAPCCYVKFTDCKYTLAEKTAAAEEIMAMGDKNICNVWFEDDHVIVVLDDAAVEEFTKYSDLFNEEYGDMVLVTVAVEDEIYEVAEVEEIEEVEEEKRAKDAKTEETANVGEHDLEIVEIEEGADLNGTAEASSDAADSEEAGLVIGGDVMAVIPEENANGFSLPLWAWITAAALIIAAIAAFVLNRTKLIPALRASDGSTALPAGKISRKAAVKAVKDSEVKPDEKVFENVMKKIDK